VPRVLRLFRFKPATPQFDETVRRTLLPDLGQLPGLLDVVAGRRVSIADDDRVVASIWRSWSDMQDAVGASPEESPFHPELLEESTNRKFAAAPIVFGDLYRAGAEPRVLRVVEGSVHDGEFDRYVAEAEAGTRDDAAAGRGPVTLYLARSGTNDFVTLSTWIEWDDVQDSTGGDIRRPQATRHAERLVAWSASHFEIVGPEPAG
jgi:hypothetical protein